MIEKVSYTPWNNASFFRRIDVCDTGYRDLSFCATALNTRLAQKLINFLSWPLQGFQLFVGIEAFSEHGIRLTRSCLTVSKNGTVKSFDDISNALVYVSINFILVFFLIEYPIILGLNVMGQIS